MTGKNDVPPSVAGLTTPESSLRDPAAIEANRRGQVSAGQRAALAGIARRAAVALFALLAGGAVVGGLLWWMAPDSPLLVVLPVLALALLGLPQIRELLLLRRIQREAQTAVVQHTIGRVVADRGPFKVEGLDAPLRTTALKGLAPGRYRFYYLPGTRWLLSAEALGDKWQAAEPAATGPSLAERMAKAFQTTPDELAANRAGELAPAQARRSRTVLSGQLLFCGLLILLAGFALWWMLPVLEGAGAGANPASDLLQPGLFAIVAIVMVVYSLRQAILLLLDLRGKRVVNFESALYRGTAKSTWTGVRGYYFTDTEGDARQGSRWGIFRVQAGRTLDVPQAAHDALEPGRRYCVYQLPRTGRLVAVEPSAAGVEARAATPAPEGARPRRRVKRR